MTQAHRPFSDEERQTVQTMALAGCSDYEIAKKLGRTNGAIFTFRKRYRIPSGAKVQRNEAEQQYRQLGTPLTDPVAALARQGYEDWRSIKRFPPEYETWNEPRQRTYEAGRRVASLMIKHINPLPPWPVDKPFEEVFARIPDAAAEALRAENAFTANRREVA